MREVLIDVQDRKEKILFFDGEPRFEVKFIRRAVADDPNLQLVVLQRTADNNTSASSSTAPTSSPPDSRRRATSCSRIAA